MPFTNLHVGYSNFAECYPKYHYTNALFVLLFSEYTMPFKEREQCVMMWVRMLRFTLERL